MQKLLEMLGVSGGNGLIIPALVTLTFGVAIGYAWVRVQRAISESTEAKIEAIDEHNSRVRSVIAEGRLAEF